MEYPKKGCDVGYFLSTGTNQNSITILRRSSVTKPCFLSIGLRSDRWQSAQIKDQADLHFLEKVISRCSVRCILGFRVLGFYWEYPKKGCDLGYFLRSKFNKIQLPFCDAQVSPNPVFCRSDWDRTGGRSTTKWTCIFLKKWSLAAAYAAFCDCQLGVSQKWLPCGILLKTLKRHQKESNLNDFCRFPCTGHCKFTVWNGVSQKRLPCGILFITQPPIAKVGWDCSESKVMPTKGVNDTSPEVTQSGLRLQRESSSSADVTSVSELYSLRLPLFPSG